MIKALLVAIKQKFFHREPDIFESQKIRVAELREQFQAANKELAVAEYKFNQASQRDVDICTYELKAAETRVSLIIQEMKELQEQMN